MANEVQITAGLACTNGNAVNSLKPGTLNADQATVGSHSPIAIITTADTVIPMGDLVAPGWVLFRNLDATNYVSLGPTSGGAIVKGIRIKAGKTAGPFFIEPSSVWRAQANTASIKLQMVALET